ncbi:hypothetical protein CLAFUW4_00840 [Fulvia fulva]|uniref:Uncharacterized protein n=1 Tax=Passalora fulva TaxID=5499 RepID=A0A9Q8P2L5_PASFU|nr:uncharacterized protein CLAFUR5_00843 [Fulvia fulva]KAK4634366.1 hypothetical protein CLAFUR4_00841 [Fulvia fulva]KAK4636762.1 hypothetical protein CLAFUR0_00841 [Fulvia fulva]UJO10831.1 hypothetical protein CLAFUR5_00843 [Fulvia fulva]WPV10128.1 hypothetical protein CLAFUW4_00840 [Fulvia fulva]WPV24172.1 hypothetical protein CLAFUW7_00976 [Fulvia fulva]
MQYSFTLSALAATAFAQNNQNQDDQADQSVAGLASVISVLQTALPSSLIQEALTNSAAVASDISAEFAAGSTPAWFTALPTDVQTYLVPSQLYPNATATGTLISVGPTNSANATGYGNSTRSSSTSGRSTNTVTATETGEGSEETGASATQGESSSSSSAGASMPSAIVGMGLAGAVGLVGVLAL